MEKTRLKNSTIKPLSTLSILSTGLKIQGAPDLDTHVPFSHLLQLTGEVSTLFCPGEARETS